MSTDVRVQVPFAAPSMANEKDVRHEKRVFTRFFVVMTPKFFNSEPKMTFTVFEDKTGVELSHSVFFRMVEKFCG